MGLSVTQGGKRGANVIQNAETGWQLHWRRPLQQELRGSRPTVRRHWAPAPIPAVPRALPSHRLNLLPPGLSLTWRSRPALALLPPLLPPSRRARSLT